MRTMWWISSHIFTHRRASALVLMFWKLIFCTRTVKSTFPPEAAVNESFVMRKFPQSFHPIVSSHIKVEFKDIIKRVNVTIFLPHLRFNSFVQTETVHLVLSRHFSQSLTSEMLVFVKYRGESPWATEKCTVRMREDDEDFSFVNDSKVFTEITTDRGDSREIKRLWNSFHLD